MLLEGSTIVGKMHFESGETKDAVGEDQGDQDEAWDEEETMHRIPSL